MEEKRASNLDEAWINFDPYTPLPAGSPFYVDRPGNPLSFLKWALLRSHELPRSPKYFFSGHRGSGKSTELNRLAADTDVRRQFVIIYYSIRDFADVNDLDHLDILFTMGAQMFLQYTDEEDGYGKKLPGALLDELQGLRGRIMSRARITDKQAEAASDVGLKAFFLNAMLKIKQEETSRREIRQELQPAVTDWIRQINLIASTISAQEKKQVLVMIDDLDKPPLEAAKAIFHGYVTLLSQPAFPVIYTVPLAVFFHREFVAISEGRRLLPSIKLHKREDRQQRDAGGFSTMKNMIFKRIEEDLIDQKALEEVIRLSGGVMRDMARLIQIAVDYALDAGRAQIHEQDVTRAGAELRNDFRRMLSGEDIELLRQVFSSQELTNPDQLAPLLYISAVIEYLNNESWVDVHPIVIPLLAE
jgi:histone H3/H4